MCIYTKLAEKNIVKYYEARREYIYEANRWLEEVLRIMEQNKEESMEVEIEKNLLVGADGKVEETYNLKVKGDEKELVANTYLAVKERLDQALHTRKEDKE